MKCQQQWHISAVRSHVHNLNCRYPINGAKELLQLSLWLSFYYYRLQLRTRLVYIQSQQTCYSSLWLIALLTVAVCELGLRQLQQAQLSSPPLRVSCTCVWIAFSSSACFLLPAISQWISYSETLPSPSGKLLEAFQWKQELLCSI